MPCSCEDDDVTPHPCPRYKNMPCECCSECTKRCETTPPFTFLRIFIQEKIGSGLFVAFLEFLDYNEDMIYTIRGEAETAEKAAGLVYDLYAKDGKANSFEKRVWHEQKQFD